MGKLIPQNWIVTEDGSLTFFSDQFGENCHSLSGAREETLLHYLHGCDISSKIDTSRPLVILEVGLGTGLGYLLTRELFMTKGSKGIFLSLEINEDYVRGFAEREGLVPEIKNADNYKTFLFHMIGLDLTVLVGNARTTLPAFLKDSPIRFDAIYQDAFSPKRNPVLWTTEWFTLLKEYSRPDVILSTYSASNSIRKSLSEAGWMIRKGEAFGPKRASTRAFLEGGSDEEILAQMSRSPAEAIRDSQLPKELFL